VASPGERKRKAGPKIGGGGKGGESGNAQKEKKGALKETHLPKKKKQIKVHGGKAMC